MKPERRSTERVAVEVEVNFSSDSQFFAGLSGDVSEGGLFVQTYQRHSVGSTVAVDFTLPNGRIQAKGVVQWVRQASEGGAPGIGIAFEELPSAERKLIEDFCRSRPPLYCEVDLP